MADNPFLKYTAQDEENPFLKYVKPQRSAAYEQGRTEPNPIIRGLANVIQGPTFGFGDEIAAGVSAAVRAPFSDRPFSELYGNTRDYLRGVQDEYKRDFPIGSVATQLMMSAPMIAKNVAGRAVEGAASMVAPQLAARYGQWVAPAGEVAGVLPRAVHGGLSGLTFGALAGAGDSTAQTMGGVAEDAAKGGAFGAAMGAATPVLTSGINAIVNQVAPRFSDQRAADLARQKVAEALARDVEGTPADPVRRAASRMATLGPEARVVDAAGENTRALLDTVATLPGASKQQVERAIRERQAGRAGRLVDAADDVLGTRGQAFDGALQQFDAVRQQAARPLYDQLRGLSVRVDDDIANLLSKTESVHREAERLYRLKNGSPIDLTAIKPGDDVPFEVLDVLKGSLYDAATSAKRSGSNRMGSAFDDARVALTEKLVSISPKDAQGQSIYRQALDAWAGPSQLMDAAEIGRKAMRDDAFAVKDAVASMTKSEIEAMRVGALQALREKTGTQAGQTSLLKMWMEPATRERLKTVFGNDYRAFAAEVAREARLKPLEQVGRGSQTAARQFGAGDLDMAAISDAASAARSVASGSPVGFMQSAASAWNRVRTPEPVRDAIGRLLLSRDPDEIQSLTGLLGGINATRAENAARAGQFTGLLY